MDLDLFGAESPGDLVAISGNDPRRGDWKHVAFVPHSLPTAAPTLSSATYRTVANARAALAALDSTARRLPNPSLFRRPALRREAQSTSALEGTYAPLADVLTADEDHPPTADLKEIFNYVVMGDTAFEWVNDGREITIGTLEELQGLLVAGTPGETTGSGSLRDHQVVIGRRREAGPDEIPVRAARFVPSPPGLDLRARVQDLLGWTADERIVDEFDPVIASALAHYQFEALHPFHDGNGRMGRLLIVVQLVQRGVLLEPTLTVSPWFESWREQYYDELLGVSTHGTWDSYVRFFAAGLEASARGTHDGMLRLLDVQRDLKDILRGSSLRADTAHTLVDYALANTSFTVRSVQRDLGLSYGRANGLVTQLVALGILASDSPVGGVNRRFFAPQMLDVLLGR